MATPLDFLFMDSDAAAATGDGAIADDVKATYGDSTDELSSSNSDQPVADSSTATSDAAATISSPSASDSSSANASANSTPVSQSNSTTDAGETASQVAAKQAANGTAASLSDVLTNAYSNSKNLDDFSKQINDGFQNYLGNKAADVLSAPLHTILGDSGGDMAEKLLRGAGPATHQHLLQQAQQTDERQQLINRIAAKNQGIVHSDEFTDILRSAQ